MQLLQLTCQNKATYYLDRRIASLFVASPPSSSSSSSSSSNGILEFAVADAVGACFSKTPVERRGGVRQVFRPSRWKMAQY